jgi:hypothetical protein
MKVFSSGGGVQSTAVLVLAARGELDYRQHVFANTGDDSEHPAVLDYVRQIAKPYAEANGLELIEISKGGKTLYERVMSAERSVPIPARMANGAPGNRTCTVDFKIRQVDRWIGQNGGRDAETVDVGLGISTDEIQRARKGSREWVKRNKYWKRIRYPLIELGISRSECLTLVAEAGLPQPPRSACYFCPFHTDLEWRRLRVESPDLFQKSVEIEQHINVKRQTILNKDRVWLHPALIPLDQALDIQMSFDDLDNCESGFCLT